ncbi:MAG TPA: EpsI family protein [Longimicrobiaceae bacterium]|nr:EpsI family protein [Longimicrobiaceae bacterium]
MSTRLMSWAPASVLLVGVLAVSGGIRDQVSMPLRAPLATSIPTQLAGYSARDLPISEAEQRVAGMDSYVLREYTAPGAAAAAFSVYVGYYQRQYQGHTIHSPKNCLPGAGWEPLVAAVQTISGPRGPVPVNRYLIANGPAHALVLYWYQGRGRVTANEYRVKWNLLQDQAIRGRSDESLVRVVVPVTGSEQEADSLAVEVAQRLLPAVGRALPS